MYLKHSPTKGVVKICMKGKFGTCYVRPYEILQKISKVAYELRLSSEFTFGSSGFPCFYA